VVQQIKEINEIQRPPNQNHHIRNRSHQTAQQIPIIQPSNTAPWTRLAPRKSLASIERDICDRYLPQTRSNTPVEISDESHDSHTDISSESSIFTFSPATWTPQEIDTVTPPIPQNSPLTKPKIEPELPDDDNNMTDTVNTFFSGKPEDQDPQDFMNRIERTILMKSGLMEADRVRFFELSLKAKSPAEAWLATLTAIDKASFKAIRAAFELRWPAKPISDKTTAEKQALLDETILKPSDLGRRVAASLGAEEELSHVVWADKVERLAGDIPDTNNLLVASTCKKLPKALLKLVSRKPVTWKQFADEVREVSLEELMEKIEEERDATRYAPVAPNTPSKALGTAFQNINLTPQSQPSQTGQYQPQQAQPVQRTPFGTYSERPAHERLADVLSKALPLQPNNPEGLLNYNNQVATWQAAYGQSGKGPTETRPYPLTPGTVPVASGECWKCGNRAHHPAPCLAPPVPAIETKWRSIAQTIRKKAEAAAAAAVNVNLVNITSNEVNTYDAEELAHLQQLIDQGKAGGSST
jgi:hypothetical protein